MPERVVPEQITLILSCGDEVVIHQNDVEPWERGQVAPCPPCGTLRDIAEVVHSDDEQSDAIESVKAAALAADPTLEEDPRQVYSELSPEQAWSAWPCATCRTRRDEHADQPDQGPFPELAIRDHPFRVAGWA